MLLGQLFYYIKVLDKYEFNLENIQSLELLSVDKLPTLEDMSDTEAKRKVRDIFSNSYQTFLKSNGFSWASDFWLELTSPNLNNHKFSQPYSDFSTVLLDWKNTGFLITKLQEVLKEGKFSNNDQDISLFYGLKVLHKFSEIEDIQTTGVLPEIFDLTNEEINLHKEILVLTELYKAPLFTNLNCEFLSLPDSLSPKEILDKIETKLGIFPTIQLILIDKSDNESLITFLNKYLPNVLITSLELNNQSENYFDKIVKSTLGIRLN